MADVVAVNRPQQFALVVDPQCKSRRTVIVRFSTLMRSDILKGKFDVKILGINLVSDRLHD